MNDKDFFHQATLRICGSIELDSVVGDCFDFLKQFMPVNTLSLNIYDPDAGAIKNVAQKTDNENMSFGSSVWLSDEAKEFLEKPKPSKVIVVKRQKDHVVGRILSKAFKAKEISGMVMFLETKEKLLGGVSLFSSGYDNYSKEHARLLALLHDPFAVAMSNALRYHEVVKLKDMLVDDNRYLSHELHRISGEEIIGRNLGLKDVMEMVRQVAPLNSSALLLGETGVGKEVIANTIHYSSPRSRGPFIKVNCGAIPESLIDSELFGHEKGAFTGAVSRKRGRFERAHTGSIFLDEIGELHPQAQVRLLRVIQNMEIERVGGEKPVPVNIRIIAASHRNLEEMVRAGKFREDLWYRLNVFPITVPPLRHRLSDIPSLVNYFIEQKSMQMNLKYYPVLAPGAIERLQSYHWPGNVRELENAIERALILSSTASTDEPLRFNDFPPVEAKAANSKILSQESISLKLDEAMRNHIQKVLDITNGKIQGRNGAAAILGIHSSTLRNRMIKLGISFKRKQKQLSRYYT